VAGRRRQGVEVLVAERDQLAVLGLEALDDVGVVDLLAVERAGALVLDAAAVGAVHLVEPDVVVGGRRVQLDRHADQPEGDGSAPHRPHGCQHDRVQPMLATPGALPTGPEWLYEVKWDGMRVLADVDSGALTLRGRSGRDVTPHFPELADVARLAPDVLLDGEVVLLDGGVPSSGALADRMHRAVDERTARRRPVTFMAFDVLRLYGVDLRARPLHERRATLERLGTAALSTVSLSPVYTDGAALLDATGRRGMEGVVAKRRDGGYRPGERSPGWVVVTHRRTQPCLVGGWRTGRTGPPGSTRCCSACSTATDSRSPGGSGPGWRGTGRSRCSPSAWPRSRRRPRRSPTACRARTRRVRAGASRPSSSTSTTWAGPRRVACATPSCGGSATIWNR
jgi:ATP-dependent DNA ligase